MQARFDATLDDFVDVRLRTLSGSRTATVRRWQRVFATAVLAGLPLYLISPESRRLKLGLLAFAFITLGHLVTYKSFLRGKLRALLRADLGGKGPVPVRVELTSFGIKFEQLGGQYFSDWSTIERLEETQDAIYFYQHDRSCMAVRKRAFESPESKAQFMEVAQKYLNSPDERTALLD